MHGLQLSRQKKRKLAVTTLLIAIGLICLLVAAAPFFLIHERSPDLKLAPLGFSYQGAPLTGIIYAWHPGWKLSRLTVVRGGKLHGPDLQWHANSQRSLERHYRDGLESGTHKAWYENGKVRFLKTFVNGAPHGDFYEWHDNGQLAQFVLYEHGQEKAAKSWTAGGKPFYNYLRKDNETIGFKGDTYCSPRK